MSRRVHRGAEQAHRLEKPGRGWVEPGSVLVPTGAARLSPARLGSPGEAAEKTDGSVSREDSHRSRDIKDM